MTDSIVYILFQDSFSECFQSCFIINVDDFLHLYIELIGNSTKATLSVPMQSGKECFWMVDIKKQAKIWCAKATTQFLSISLHISRIAYPLNINTIYNKCNVFALLTTRTAYSRLYVKLTSSHAEWTLTVVPIRLIALILNVTIAWMKTTINSTLFY